MGTSGTDWESDYIRNDFVHHDPMVSLARRINTPFTWGDVAIPTGGQKKSKSEKLMDASQDHGFREGLVVPLHFRDQLGRLVSCLTVFFWKDRPKDFRAMLPEHKHELNLVLLYWIQKVVDIVAKEHRGKVTVMEAYLDRDEPVLLTPRERDILSWSARGKTYLDIAQILSISVETVKSHAKTGIQKVDASNRTHAVARALMLGLIDV